jgi:hypothetical protein
LDVSRNDIGVRAELIRWLARGSERGLSLPAVAVCSWVRDECLLEQLASVDPQYGLFIDSIDEGDRLLLNSSLAEHESRVQHSDQSGYTDGLSLLIEWLAHDISRMCRGLDPGA